jgi:hypothetical protein
MRGGENDGKRVCVGIFVSDTNASFPNYYPVGIFSTREMALEQLKELTREHNYEIVKLPIDTFFGYIDRKGALKDGVGELHHEH